MSADEEKTLVVLKGHRRELIDPLIDQHRGRIFKTTGDGMLIEFASVVDAVRCAIVVQQGMEDRNTNLPESERIRFRIGINLGDVMVDEGDMFGDGVNVAARIEALAAPGEICDDIPEPSRAFVERLVEAPPGCRSTERRPTRRGRT
jgi:adenylate cyclase